MREDLRLAVLEVLAAADPDDDLNTSIVRKALDDLGLRPSADQQRAAIAWLDEQGLITVVALSRSVSRMHLTERGLDVAEGRAAVPGVARPGPVDAL
ncbi:MAG: ArsR family transcriptional regulator [Holophagales bacterium]|nr:ArsR family transcriptional regulator [Holophagales bacterium]MYC11919.1 ArsR family transcriptional regulator [Holophagales bacterium]